MESENTVNSEALLEIQEFKMFNHNKKMLFVTFILTLNGPWRFPGIKWTNREEHINSLAL